MKQDVSSDAFLLENAQNLELRDAALLKILTSQPNLGLFDIRTSCVEIRASGDLNQKTLLPYASLVTVNSTNAAEALWAVQNLPKNCGVIFLRNTLQFLIETRQFLEACFNKVQIGGFLIISVPDQFLYEKKLRLPSRRNALHRRLYTPNTLLADLEESVDASEYKVRYLAETDEGFDYSGNTENQTIGGQDILLVAQKNVKPSWRDKLDDDEIWSEPPSRPSRYVKIDRSKDWSVQTILPDTRNIKRIAVLKLDHRGDFLMANDAFCRLRSSFSDAYITLFCGSWNKAEAEAIGIFDEVIAFDFFPEDDSSRLSHPTADQLITEFKRRYYSLEFDLAIDLRMFDDTRDVLRSISARHKAGFDRHDYFPWLSIRMAMISGTADDRAEESFISADKFHTAVGRHLTYEIECGELPNITQRTHLIWGPYQTLQPGTYQLTCQIEAKTTSSSIIMYDIVSAEGTKVLCAGHLKIVSGHYPTLTFQTAETVQSFELRFFASDVTKPQPFCFRGLKIVRQGLDRCLHQSEAMYLLVDLTALRLRNPYVKQTL